MLKGKKIVIGVTGSIAAYKAAILVRLLVKQGAEVQVVMTPSSKEFITPLTLSTLSGRPVLCDFFNSSSGEWHSHVELGLWADAMIIAPATAATIGKMAGGIADNLLVTTYLSMKAPVFVAPAMDLDMFAHPSTQHNLQVLRSYGNHIIEPAAGELASHLCGKGRMEEPENIVAVLKDFFLAGNSLAGKRILITAGPTYEKIDPVRFIGNYSSGKMGFALAAECAARGADVTLVAGPVSLKTPHATIKRVDVESAEEMREKKLSFSGEATRELAVMRAAIDEILVHTERAFLDDDVTRAVEIEPLEQVVDDLRDAIKLNHVRRLQKNECTIEHGFILSDLLTNFERVSDHCSNIGGCIVEISSAEALDLHHYLNQLTRGNPEFEKKYSEYKLKYSIGD